MFFYSVLPRTAGRFTVQTCFVHVREFIVFVCDQCFFIPLYFTPNCFNNLCTYVCYLVSTSCHVCKHLFLLKFPTTTLFSVFLCAYLFSSLLTRYYPHVWHLRFPCFWMYLRVNGRCVSHGCLIATTLYYNRHIPTIYFYYTVILSSSLYIISFCHASSSLLHSLIRPTCVYLLRSQSFSNLNPRQSSLNAPDQCMMTKTNTRQQPNITL